MYGVPTMVNAAGSEIKGVIDCDTIFLVPTLEMVRTEVEKISSTNYGKLIPLKSHWWTSTLGWKKSLNTVMITV